MEYFGGQSIKSLEVYQSKLLEKLEKYKSMALDLNMARGKPCKEQLDLSNRLINGNVDLSIGADYRNYGLLDGIPEAKTLFAKVLGVDFDEIIIGGNSSLSMMYDTIVKAMLFGNVDSSEPWGKLETVKFLCPVPGYDRHFSICEQFDIEMINIEMDENGPNMDQVEALVKADSSIKGMWCVPKYSNPSGITYSDEVVKRLATMDVAAKDFRIFWDNAYVVHHLTEIPDDLMCILKACKDVNHDNRVLMFTSTSKITFPGSGVTALGASKENIAFLKKQMAYQTIGPNKINQLLHVDMFKNLQGIEEHMKKHAEIIKPKFDMVLRFFDENLKGKNIARWNSPKGGYFISLDVLDGCAKDVVSLCKECGVILTDAGATFPYKLDPKDSNIRIAPTFPAINELEMAIEVLCDCINYICVNKVLL